MEDVYNAVRRTLGPSDKNPKPITALGQLKMTQAKTGGFPMHLYHADLDPMLAVNEAQAETLKEMGYQQEYIPKAYPKMLHRRNTNSPFAEKRDIGTGAILSHDYIESRQVLNEKAERALVKRDLDSGCGQWYGSIAEVEKNDPLSEDSAEETQLRIARLEAALAEARKRDQKFRRQRRRRAYCRPLT